MSAKMQCRLGLGPTCLVGPRPNLHLKGFTLIEILIILVIFSISFSFALFSFGDFGKSRQVKSTAEQLQNVVAYFREQAILGANNYTLNINKTSYSISPSASDPSAPLPNQMKKGLFPSQIIATPPCQIEIQSSGNITPFSVYLGTQQKPKQVRLTGSANGKLQINTN